MEATLMDVKTAIRDLRNGWMRHRVTVIQRFQKTRRFTTVWSQGPALRPARVPTLAFPSRPMLLLAQLLPAQLFTALLFTSLFVSGALAQTNSDGKGPAALIEAIELRREGDRLNLHFKLSTSVSYRVVANLPRRVVVVKFSNAKPTIAAERTQFAYNDPMVVGIAFEDVNGRDTWAKICLRTSHVTFKAAGANPGSEMVLGLEPAPFPEGIDLTGLRLGRHGGGSRIVMDLSAIPVAEEHRDGDLFTVRLKGTRPRLTTPTDAEDARVALLSADLDGEDILVRIRVKRTDLIARQIVLPNPPRLVFDFRAEQARAPAVATTLPEAPQRRGLQELSLEALLDQEPNPLIRANYLLAQREHRAGNFIRANLLFLRVYDTQPESLLGVRAYFRAADAQYDRAVDDQATNLHDIIITYQAAIRAAEAIDYKTSLVPRALFQIGRAYQIMEFNFESNVHYQILQGEHPDSYPYTPDSFYFEGLNFVLMQRSEEGVVSFQRFLASEGNDALIGPARYNLGDAYFNLKRYVEAKTQFDKARRLDPKFPDERPLLIFHMGEAYYENAEFDLARVFYQTLLERYPDKNYTKLVGLRLGDFLREEGKEIDAMRIYRSVAKNAPLEIRLRGKLRMANLLAEHPASEDYKEAVKLYDEITAEGEDLPILQEALLRKALALTLHGQHQAALNTFEALGADHPEGIYARDNLIRHNIDENLKSLISQLFKEDKFWDVAKTYTRYREKYFTRFRFPSTLYQIGNAYQRLGLYDEAVAMYDRLLRQRSGGALTTLILMQKAHALLEKDDLGSAEEALLQFIQDRKEDIYLIDARKLLGNVYAAGRRYEDALKAYQILVREFESTKNPDLGEAIAEVFYEQGQIFRELGRFKEALDSFQNAVENFHHPIQGASVPEFIILGHFLQGDMFYELGQNREAVEAYRQGIALYGEHVQAPWARYQIGLIYRRTGEDRKALDEFNLLVELAKTRPGELWEPLAKENQRDLSNKLDYQTYLKQ